MTEPANTADSAVVLQRLRAGYDAAARAGYDEAARAGDAGDAVDAAGDAIGNTSGDLTGDAVGDTVVDAADKALTALRSAVHTAFPSAADRARTDPLLDGFGQVTEGMARLVDDHRKALRNCREAVELAKELHRLEPPKRPLGKGSAEARHQKAVRRIDALLADPLTKPLDRVLRDVVGTSLNGLSQGLLPPEPSAAPEPAAGPQPPRWQDDPALLRTLHELVKAAHAAPGTFDEPIEALKKQLAAQDIVVVDTLTADTASCFLFHADENLPPGTSRVADPALARVEADGPPVVLPGRSGLVLQGPFRPGAEETP